MSRKEEEKEKGNLSNVSPSRGFIIPHIRRTVDLSLRLIPGRPLRLFEIDICFFSFRLVEPRRRQSLSLSLSFILFLPPFPPRNGRIRPKKKNAERPVLSKRNWPDQRGRPPDLIKLRRLELEPEN